MFVLTFLLAVAELIKQTASIRLASFELEIYIHLNPPISSMLYSTSLPHWRLPAWIGSASTTPWQLTCVCAMTKWQRDKVRNGSTLEAEIEAGIQDQNTRKCPFQRSGKVQIIQWQVNRSEKDMDENPAICMLGDATPVKSCECKWKWMPTAYVHQILRSKHNRTM